MFVFKKKIPNAEKASMHNEVTPVTTKLNFFNTSALKSPNRRRTLILFFSFLKHAQRKTKLNVTTCELKSTQIVTSKSLFAEVMTFVNYF